METISPVYARLVLRELEQLEIDTAALFAGTGLTRDTLLRGGDIALPDFLHVLREGHSLFPGGKLGFMLGRNMHTFALGPLGAGMSVAPSLRAGLQLLESYTRLHITYIESRARSTLTGLTLSIHYHSDTGDMERFHTETAILLFQQYIETLAGKQVCDTTFRLAISEPQNPSDYRQAIHGSVSFDAPVTEIDIPRHWLDQASPYYHAQLWEQAQLTLSKHLKSLSETEGMPFTQHVQALLRSSEPPLPDLAAVASNLHLSERTLNRRLQGESTNFRALKSQALTQWATLYLEHSNHSVESIAAILGYQDTANFRRAFRKVTNCSPNEYRLTTRTQ